MTRDYLAQSGLGMSEWRLLAAVGRFGVLSPTAAGACTSMDKVKVSRAAASLVGRLLRLTRKGSTVYASVPPTSEKIEAMLAEGLSKSEWSALNRALGKLMAH